MKPKAVVAMSGGVDSSVAAALMKDAGYEVTGIMMKLWEGPAANNESGCCSLSAAEDARRVAQVIDIPFYVFNFARKFSETVIAEFVSEYERGRTPNPCVSCNRSIKFAALLDRAIAFGADVLVTGHYARVDTVGGKFRLRRGIDPNKDQSYVLYMLDQDELGMARFPVGEYAKSEIREIAGQLGLRTANKPESQEICFVPNGDSHAFLQEALPEGSQPGAVVDSSGTVLGTHRGFAHYTVGQRRGVGVALGAPVFVKEIRARENQVVVAPRESMSVRAIELQDVTFGDGEPRLVHAQVMTRYRGPQYPALIEPKGSGATVTFDESVPSPAPGQAAVFYDGDLVLGGGTICKVA